MESLLSFYIILVNFSNLMRAHYATLIIGTELLLIYNILIFRISGINFAINKFLCSNTHRFG